MNTFISYKSESGKLFLTADESWHCAKVLRMKAGETIRVIDGKGNAYEAKLVSVNEKQCIAEIVTSIEEKKRDYVLHVAIAPTKNMDRIEWFSEKATELGIDEITFIIGKNSERKIIKTERVKKIVESAAKQSMQSFIPAVHEATELKKFIESVKDFPGKKMIAHCEESRKPSEEKNLKDLISSEISFLILIGPEGDFTKEEIDLALKNNFVPVSLGQSRLRTETAGVFVAAGIKALKS